VSIQKGRKRVKVKQGKKKGLARGKSKKRNKSRRLFVAADKKANGNRGEKTGGPIIEICTGRMP